MRDVLFKNATSLNHRKRDVFLSEVVKQGSVITKTQKHFVYFIRDHEFLDNAKKLENWVKKYAHNAPRLKNLSVLKVYNRKRKEERLKVKITGTLYVLREQDIFNVDFSQIFKIERLGRP